MNQVQKDIIMLTLKQLEKNLAAMVAAVPSVKIDGYSNLKQTITILRGAVEDLRFELADVVF